MKKMSVLIGLLLFAMHAHAGVVCRVSCAGTNYKVIDENQAFYNDAKKVFETQCAANNGKVIDADTGGKFDKLGCYYSQPDYRGYGQTFSYCVTEETISGEGYGNANYPKENGAETMAYSHAVDACKFNVTRINCGSRLTEFGQNVEPKNFKVLTSNCYETKDH